MSAGKGDQVRRIVVIGGGITGLSAAHRLQEVEPGVQITLVEASDALGGVLKTTVQDGFLMEHGADMFTTREPWALDLCRRLGMEEDLIEPNPDHRRAFIVHQGGLCPVPEGFTLMSPTQIKPLLATRLLSWKAKLRMGWEFFVPRRTATTDESLADFARRRLGIEAYERLVQPLIGGIYTADPERLSMQAALPQFVEMERQHGGLIRGVAKTRARSESKNVSGARYGMFVAPRAGMSQLVAEVAKKLPSESICLGRRVRSVSRSEDAWHVKLDGDEVLDCDGVILAIPSHRAAELLNVVSEPLAAELSAIPYASAAIVVLGYHKRHIGHPLDGFGCVAPACENRRILSVSFSHVKFAGRAPQDHALLRAFVGGACQSELVDLTDQELLELVRDELRDLLDVSGSPVVQRVVRWRNAMPQYHLNHVDRIARIDELSNELKGLQIAGNALRGVGIPFCVRSGEAAAERLLAEATETCSTSTDSTS